jgi:hypothetical protein
MAGTSLKAICRCKVHAGRVRGWTGIDKMGDSTFESVPAGSRCMLVLPSSGPPSHMLENVMPARGKLYQCIL